MMKRLTFAAAVLLAASTIDAQSVYDAAQITHKDLNGTARFVSMGGAMGALGGDISTMGTNPAGIGIYRSHDLMTSFSFRANSQTGKYNGYDNSVSKSALKYNNMVYDNLGFVYSTQLSNVSPLRFVNFGFNYHKAKSFYKNTSMNGALNVGPNGEQVSQLWQMANQANGVPYSKYLEGEAAFTDVNLGWLSVLGWQGWLINEHTVDPTNGNMYKPFTNYVPNAKFYSEERGGVDQYDLNVAFNVNDRFYFGATLGLYDVYYSKHTLYDESFDDLQGYELQSYNGINGSGVDFKLGLIVRPFEYSPFRIGVAVHTPAFYNLTYTTRATLVSDVTHPGESSVSRTRIDTYDMVGDMKRSFQLRTPWLYNVSLGYTLGTDLAVGAEYEYQDYSTVRFYEPDGMRMEYETSEVKYCLQGVHTLRLGLEYNVLPRFALRFGYNYSTSIFKNDSFKNLPINSINTDTDYANSKERMTYTAGIGYRGRVFYADLAYKYNTYKEDFFAFHDADNFLKATEMKNVQNQVLMTLGVRF